MLMRPHQASLWDDPKLRLQLRKYDARWTNGCFLIGKRTLGVVPVNDRFWPTPVIGNLPRLTGRLVSVSADAFEDERSGLHYYEAEVKIDRAVLEAAAPEVRLTPGMPAEVYVAIRERTVLAYPARQSFGLLLRRSPNLNPTQ